MILLIKAKRYGDVAPSGKEIVILTSAYLREIRESNVPPKSAPDDKRSLSEVHGPAIDPPVYISRQIQVSYYAEFTINSIC